MQIKTSISNSQESREGSRGRHQIWTLPPIFQTLNHYTTEDLKAMYVHYATNTWLPTVVQPTLYNIVGDVIDSVGIVCYITMHS